MVLGLLVSFPRVTVTNSHRFFVKVAGGMSCVGYEVRYIYALSSRHCLLAEVQVGSILSLNCLLYSMEPILNSSHVTLMIAEVSDSKMPRKYEFSELVHF